MDYPLFTDKFLISVFLDSAAFLTEACRQIYRPFGLY